MSSNGLTKRAKKGKCRMCQRSRCTETKVKAVGERNHGYAVGHIWECIDVVECDMFSENKLNDPTTPELTRVLIEVNKKIGRFITYKYFS